MASRGKLVVVGQGYVGLPLALRAVSVGWDVVGLDVDAQRVKRLAAGESFLEDVTADDVRVALDTGRYLPSVHESECCDFDVAVISVPTPLREGVPDLRHTETAAGAIGRHLRPGATVVLESTTYPGTTRDVIGPILEQASGLVAGKDFRLGYSPERIDPGNATWGLVNTPKVVSGITPACRDAVDAFFSTIVDQTVVVGSTETAELTKLLENTFRHVNIALVNELAMFSRQLGLDIWDAIDAAATKPFGFMAFRPGPGVGGHCLPIDPSYLSWRVKQSLGRPFRFVELANDVNDHMPDYVVHRLMTGLNEHGKPLKGSRILLLGLAYKPNTADARESPAVEVARLLVGYGAEVRAADPHVADNQVPSGVRRVELCASEVDACDAAVLLVDHEAFDLRVVSKARYVFDVRRRVHGDAVEYL